MVSDTPASRRSSLRSSRLLSRSDDVELNPPILRSTFFRRVGIERTGEPVALCLQAIAGNSLRDQEVPDGVGAILRQFQVVLRAPAIVGMSFDADRQNVWMRIDYLGHLLQQRCDVCSIVAVPMAKWTLSLMI